MIGNPYGDPNLNPTQSSLHFPIPLILLERYEYSFSPSSYGQIVGQPKLFNLGMATIFEEGRL